MTDLVTHLINDKGVCRTAPATPGLLGSHIQKDIDVGPVIGKSVVIQMVGRII